MKYLIALLLLFEAGQGNPKACYERPVSFPYK